MQTNDDLVKLRGIYAALIAGVAIGLTACTTSKPHVAHETQSSESGHAPVALNEGKKWVVVKPMIVHLRNIELDVKQFPAKKADREDHAALAMSIQENLGRLVTNCTMEGPAHDALHQWLLPFLAVSTEYSAATHLEDQQKKFHEIEEALVAFNAHFE